VRAPHHGGETAGVDMNEEITSLSPYVIYSDPEFIGIHSQ